MDFLGKILFGTLLNFPGAFIRWLFMSKKYSLKEALLTYKYINVFISSCLLAAAFVVHHYYFKS
jgi:hypothetical protein